MSIILVSVDLLHFFRDQESSETNSHLKALNENKHDVAVKSNGSDRSYVQSVGSSSLEDLDPTLSPGDVETRVKLHYFFFSNYHICSVVQMIIDFCLCMQIDK